MTAALFRYLGPPCFALFTLSLHLWSGLVALAFGGWLATVVTLLAPVASWAWWCAELWGAAGGAAAYMVAVVAWWACLALMGMAVTAEQRS